MQFQGKCEFIYQMKPQRFDEAKAESARADASHGGAPHASELKLYRNGAPLTNGVLDAAGGIYACLTYERRMFITMITSGGDSQLVHLIFKDKVEYEQTLALIKNEFGLRVSTQDGKLVSYARSISEKLHDGIEIAIFDAQKEDDFVLCPSCGAKNKYDASMPYCMDCGEPL